MSSCFLSLADGKKTKKSEVMSSFSAQNQKNKKHVLCFFFQPPSLDSKTRKNMFFAFQNSRKKLEKTKDSKTLALSRFSSQSLKKCTHLSAWGCGAEKLKKYKEQKQRSRRFLIVWFCRVLFGKNKILIDFEPRRREKDKHFLAKEVRVFGKNQKSVFLAAGLTTKKHGAFGLYKEKLQQFRLFILREKSQEFRRPFVGLLGFIALFLFFCLCLWPVVWGILLLVLLFLCGSGAGGKGGCAGSWASPEPYASPGSWAFFAKYVFAKFLH